MRKFLLGIVLLALVMQLSVLAGEKGKKIGFSELSVSDPWRIAQVESMTNEAKRLGYDFIITNAEQKAEKQIADVEDLLAQDVDFLFIAPMDFEAIVPALMAARAKKTPVIMIDRQAKGTWPDDFVTTIQSDFIKQGRETALWTHRKIAADKPIRVVEITGKVGGSDVRDRAAGFRQGMEIANKERSGKMEIIVSQNGEWSRAEAQKVMQNIIQSTGGDFQAVYCHNDEMALGVLLALRGAGIRPNEDVYVVAVDGQKEAIEAIIDGEMGCIFTCTPRYGPVAFATMERYFRGEQLPEIIETPESLIDETNAKEKLPDGF